MKVSYRYLGNLTGSTAYLDKQLDDGSWIGTNKHSDLHVHVRNVEPVDDDGVIDEHDDPYWEEVCHRRYELVDVLNEKWAEVEPKPDCDCRRYVP